MAPAAPKAAVALIIDIGPHMQELLPDRSHDAFYYAKNCAISYIERKIFSESKDEVCLILVGSDETNNPVNRQQPDFYKNITIKCELGAANWAMCQEVELLQTTIIGNADFVEALAVAADYLKTSSDGRKGGFKEKSILLFSNLGAGTTMKDQYKTILDQLAENEVDLKFIGFDAEAEPSSPPQSQDGSQQGGARGGRKVKSRERLEAEELVRKFAETCNTYTFEFAMQTLAMMNSRLPNSTAWRVRMEIDSDLAIPVQSFVLNDKKSKVKPWKMVDGAAGDGPSTSEVKRHTKLLRADGMDGEEALDKSDLGKTYRYGVTQVEASELLEQDSKLEGLEKSFKIISVVPANQVGVHLYSGDGNQLVVADHEGGHATAARFSAFVRALAEMGYVALVRRVYNRASTPRVGILVPELGNREQRDALYYVEIPYSEELSMYHFPSLPDSNTEDSDSRMKSHRPNQEQLDAIDSLIDSAMLPTGNGEEEEAYPTGEERDPCVQHFFRCVRQRILHPDRSIELPPRSEIDTTHLRPQYDSPKRRRVVEEIGQKFVLIDKKFAADQEINEPVDEAPQTRNETDVSTFMARTLGTTATASYTSSNSAMLTSIRPENALEDFLTIIRTGNVPFERAVSMLVEVVFTILGTSIDSSDYDKLYLCLEQLRRLCIERKYAGMYNDQLRDLFKRLPKYVMFFAKLFESGLGSITYDESSSDGAVSRQQLEAFADQIRAKGGKIAHLPSSTALSNQTNVTASDTNMSSHDGGSDETDARNLLADL